MLSGLKPAVVAAHGDGIYATPSINYAAHPRYSEVKSIEKKHRTKFFPNGKYVQFVLECRVHPKNIKLKREQTLGATNTKIDENININQIEWVINSSNKSIVDFNDPDTPIICSGIMTRVTDNHPGLLPESEWWWWKEEDKKTHLCERDYCCVLGITLEELQKQRASGIKCNIIYG